MNQTHRSPPPIGDSIINDGPGLLLIVEKPPQANTLELTRQVEAALDALKPGLKDVEIDPTIFRSARSPEKFSESRTPAGDRAVFTGLKRQEIRADAGAKSAPKTTTQCGAGDRSPVL